MNERPILNLRRVTKALVPLAVGLFLLSSCIDVDENITVSADGSGVVDLSYRVARVAVDLPRATGTSVSFPLPPNPGAIESSVAKAPGLALQSFTPVSEVATIGAKTTIRFDRVDLLNALLENGAGRGFTYLSTPTLATFTQRIYPGNPSGIDQQTLDMVKSLFGDYKLVFSLHTPRRIQTVNIGSTSRDGTTASYSTTIPDIIQSKTPIVWEVTW